MSGKALRKETLLAGVLAKGERLDRFVVAQLAGVSRKAVKQALDGGQLFVDGRVERRANLLLQGGETIRLTLKGEISLFAPAKAEVLYRDEHLLALNKPAGLPAHPDGTGQANALELIRELLQGEAGAPSPEPILLHRLDADTTGVLLFALSAEVNRDLARQFAERQVQKSYLALVAGASPPEFIVSNRLKPGVRGRTVAVPCGGQPAETLFRTLASGDGISLVEASPKTGRTHQIRTHLAGEGYPLLGDLLYGGPAAVVVQGTAIPLRRHLLHAWRLTFTHPSQSRVLTISAPLPPDFQPAELGLSIPALP